MDIYSFGATVISSLIEKSCFAADIRNNYRTLNVHIF